MTNRTEKKKLLICMPDLPFPARKNGITIRYFPIIEHAYKTYDIHMLVISDQPISQESLDLASPWCSSISIYERKPKKVSLFKKLFYRAKSFLPFGMPFEVLRYDEQEIDNFVAENTRNTIYDLALCVLPMYLNLIIANVSYKRLTLDLIDSLYLHVSRRPNPSLMQSYDALMIKKWERRSLAQVDFACYISPLDRQIGAGEKYDQNKIGVIPNGLFLQDDIDEKIDFGSATIGYLGHMSYPPNIKAALRLASIYQKLNTTSSQLKLIIIGRDPTEQIKALEQHDGIRVTGTVENIWPHVKGVDIFVFPMETGSGQQNKLLETMGAGKPVISTSVGNSGIMATHGQHFIEANSDDEILSAINQLAKDSQLQQKLGEEAKKFIYKQYSWSSIYQMIDDTLLATK